MEVFEVERLLAETLIEPEVKDWVSGHILSERQVGVNASRTARNGSRRRTRCRWRSS